MDLLNSLTVVTISKHHMAHHKYNLCQLCFSEVGERKWLTEDDTWNSLWIFIVFTEMLALCCNHAVIPPFLKYCSKKPSGLEWGKAGLSLGPGQPLLLPRELSNRPLWPFSSGSALCCVCGLYKQVWKPLWASSNPASWASTAHSPATSSALAFCSLCLKYFSFRIPSDHGPPFQVSNRFNSCHAFKALSKFPS